MTVVWFRRPEADAAQLVRSPLHGLTHGGDQTVCELIGFPGAAREDGETAPTCQPADRQPETDLLFWSIHIPGGMLGLSLVALTLFGLFTLTVLALAGGQP